MFVFVKQYRVPVFSITVMSVLFAGMVHGACVQESKEYGEVCELEKVSGLAALEQEALNNCLLESVHREDEKAVCAALEDGANVNSRNKYGDTVLMVAVLNNYCSIAQVLLDKKADVQAKNLEGGTAFLDSCSRGHTFLATLLLAYKADINAKDKEGMGGLEWAWAKDYTETAFMLLDYVSVEGEDRKGTTPLMWAAGNGNKLLVQKLLGKKAPVNRVNKVGNTAFIIAYDCKHAVIQHLLLDAGADPIGVYNTLSDAFLRATPEQQSAWLALQQTRKKIESVRCPVRQISVREQKRGDCALRVLANAASINECFKQGHTLSSDRIKQYSSYFYTQGAQVLGKVDSIKNTQSMPLAKNHFMMDNLCKIFSHLSGCFTVIQPTNELQRGVVDRNGSAFNNRTICAMVDTLKQSDCGAVHFSCCIPTKSYALTFSQAPAEYHDVLISLIKERHKERPYIVYMDSNGISLGYTPESQRLITLIQESYGEKLCL